MADKQRTLKQPASVSGTGLHTGEHTTITFLPAPENYGYKFVRKDIDSNIEVPALVDYVVDLSRGTTIENNGVRIHTVEHVLAALAGLQIDNSRIELSGKEPPVIDGSSLHYVEALVAAGIEEQDAEREYFEVDETIYFKNEDKKVDIVALPTNDFRITVMIDYFNPALGSQHTGLFNLQSEFVNEFAPARTFCFMSEVQQLISQGLIKGGQIDNALVIIDKDLSKSELESIQKQLNLKTELIIGDNGYLNNSELRFKNEPARHKLLDMIGDLALVGVPLKAQILAARPGHASNFEFAKIIRSQYLKKKPLNQYKKIKGRPIFDINTLMEFMPHRYPFLMIDKVMDSDLEHQTVTSVKNVTINEPYFQGHFPSKPVMPGVLILEAMAQTGGIMLLHKVEDYKKIWVLFSGVKNAKFRKVVVPGDQLIIEVVMTAQKFGIAMFKAKVFVDGELAAEAELQAAIVKKEDEE